MPHQSHQKDPVMEAVEKSGTVLRWIHTVIIVVVLIAGAGASWAINRAQVGNLEAQISMYKADVDTLKRDVFELQLYKVTTEGTLKNIDTTLSEMKADLRALRESKGR